MSICIPTQPREKGEETISMCSCVWGKTEETILEELKLLFQIVEVKNGKKTWTDSYWSGTTFVMSKTTEQIERN